MSTIYLVTYNHDWDESASAFRTREEAVAEIGFMFECEETPDTPEFWQEVSENYEVGKWKGFQFLKLDTETLQVTDAEKESSS